MTEFGQALRLARERRELTQTQVMALTGINNKTLSGYENGVAEPDLQTLATLLRLYQGSADQLLGLKWWDWPEEKIAANLNAIQSGDLEGLRRADP